MTDPSFPATRTGRDALAIRLEELLVWGVKRGWELLRRPVDIRLTDSGVGYTHLPGPYRPAQIYVNPELLQQPRGEDLLRGLILHELGHHAFHFTDPANLRTQRRAVRERLSSLLNLIEDEHLERRLRSENPEWGEWFDALAAWAFKGEPVTVEVEDFAVLNGFSDADAARAALNAGEAPGIAVAWEYGYRRKGDDAPVPYAEFVDHVFAGIERSHPDGRLPGDLQSVWLRMRVIGEIERGNPHGIMEKLLAAPALATDDKGMAYRRLSAVADLLSPLPGETEPEDYIARIAELTERVAGVLPGFERYLTELQRSRSTKWFWQKQRTMLWNMRRGYDFKLALLPLRELSRRTFSSLFGGGEAFDVGAVLDDVLDQWNTQPVPLPDRPLRIRMHWIDMLRNSAAPTMSRFTVGLRLGLGRTAAGGDAAAKEALGLVPRNLKDKNVPELLDITREVAEIIGEQAMDAAGQPVASLIASELEKQKAVLSKPLSPEAEEQWDEVLQAARRHAERRIDQWIRTGIDPGRPVDRHRRSGSRAGAARRPPGYDRVSNPKPAGGRGTPGGGSPERDLLNITDTCDFLPIHNVVRPPPEPQEYAALLRPVRRQTGMLRRYFRDLGMAEEEVFGQLAGRRLDPARIRQLALFGDPHVMVGHERRPAPDLFIGLAIDCSGSMDGERMDKAKTFAVLILEAARKLAGVEARAIGFTDDTILDLGGAGDTAVAGLEPEGGNNDAAGLLYCAQQARASGKQHKFLVMISDGYPTECSFESLCGLVQHLEARHGMVCAQVAVDTMDADRIAFPQFTDLTEHSQASAVTRFGRMVQRLIQQRFQRAG